MIQDYKELIVWQKSMDLVVSIYDATATYPKEESFGLTSQTRRSANSIPANISEGRSRGSRKDFRQYLIIAYGSASELETHLEIARRLKYINKDKFESLSSLLLEIRKMLKVMISKLNN